MGTRTSMIWVLAYENGWAGKREIKSNNQTMNEGRTNGKKKGVEYQNERSYECVKAIERMPCESMRKILYLILFSFFVCLTFWSGLRYNVLD